MGWFWAGRFSLQFLLPDNIKYLWKISFRRKRCAFSKLLWKGSSVHPMLSAALFCLRTFSLIPHTFTLQLSGVLAVIHDIYSYLKLICVIIIIIISSCVIIWFDVAVGRRLLSMEINHSRRGTGYLMVSNSHFISGVVGTLMTILLQIVC